MRKHPTKEGGEMMTDRARGGKKERHNNVKRKDEKTKDKERLETA